MLASNGLITPRTQKVTSAVGASRTATRLWFAASGGGLGRDGNGVTDHDPIIPDEDLLDQQPYNLLAIMDVDGLRRRPEPAEKRGERFGETKRGGAVIRLIGDRLQLAADGALALAQRRAALT